MDSRDRLWITAALDAIPNGVFIIPPADGHIGVWMGARRALVICPGYLLWPGGRYSKGLPPELFSDMQGDEHDEWHELSTFRPCTDGRPIPELPEEI